MNKGDDNLPDAKKLKESIEKARRMFSVTSVMVLVKGGTFQIGDVHGDLFHSGCRPVHTVKLSYDYYIGKYLTTFEEYDIYCQSTGRVKPDDEGWGRGIRPVINVNRTEAMGYCNWLSKREGLLEAYDNKGHLLDKHNKKTTDITKVEGYRLPTEAEWEYAARGGHKSVKDTKYAGSNDIDRVGWYCYSSKNLKDPKPYDVQGTYYVGQKAPNEVGLYDMSGNVWEWCQDFWDIEFYGKSPTENPVNFNSASDCVRRGGSWGNEIEFCHIAFRDYSPLSWSDHGISLRIVRTRI